MIKYVSGLNQEVRIAAIHLAGWSDATPVAEKQSIAVQAQKIVEELAEMGGEMKKPTLYQHPKSSKHTPTPVLIIKPVIINTGTSPMEINAITIKTDQRNPFPAIRCLCIQNNLFFCFLLAFDPKTCMVNGERRCPKKNASLADKIALLSNRKAIDKKQEETPHQIAALSIEDDTDRQDYEALRYMGEEEREVVDWLIEDYIEGLSDVVYPHTSDFLDTVEVNSIKLMADNSYPRRVVVPANLKTDTGSIQTMAFLDIGLMTNFLDDCFAKEHGLVLKKKDLPLRCEVYNGTTGQDVEWEWNGRIAAVGADGETESFDICLDVTRLGKHKVMIGLLWMEEIGCFLK